MQTKARVVLNRSRLTEVQLGIADGMASWMQATIEQVHPPDRTPEGVGLVDAWGWSVYVDGKKVKDGSGDGSAVSPPRAAGISRTAGLEGLIGFGFPSRFQEIGTSHQPARPFFSPVVLAAAPSLPEHVRRAVPK